MIYFCVCGHILFFGYGLQVASAGHVPSIRYRLATVSWHLLRSLSLSFSSALTFILAFRIKLHSASLYILRLSLSFSSRPL